MPRILIVDDEPYVRAALVIALRANGFDLIAVGDGVSALREFAKSHFDLAIVDVYLPGLDGVELIKAFRERSPGFPIVAISGVLLKESQRTVLDFLASLPGLPNIVCLQKPIRPPLLLKAVQAAMAQEA
jgi:CheY-like chemotaxis protein